MFDLKVIAIRDLLHVDKVEEAFKNPRTLLIVGDQFLQASLVTINGVESTFIIESDSKILAEVPDPIKGDTIGTVAVIAERPSTDRSSILQLELGKSFKSIVGIEKLVQLFTKILLQTPGSDIFNPQIGGGLSKVIGTLYGLSDSRRIASAAVSAVDKAANDILRMQSKDHRIPADERLLSANVENVSFIPDDTSLDMRVTLTSVAGKEAISNISL